MKRILLPLTRKALENYLKVKTAGADGTITIEHLAMLVGCTFIEKINTEQLGTGVTATITGIAFTTRNKINISLSNATQEHPPTINLNDDDNNRRYYVLVPIENEVTVYE